MAQWNKEDCEKEATVLLKEMDDIFRRLKTTYEKWLQIRDESIAELKNLADNIDEHHRNCRIATVTGSSVSATGGLLVIAGLVLAPFTAGASTVLSVAGAGAGVAGGVTTAVSDITDTAITRSRCTDAQERIDKDTGVTKELINLVETFQKKCEQLGQFARKYNCVDEMGALTILKLVKECTVSPVLKVRAVVCMAYEIKALKHLSTAFGAGSNYIKITGQTARDWAPLLKAINKPLSASEKAFASGAKAVSWTKPAMTGAARLGWGAVSAVFVGLDIWTIVKDSNDLADGAMTEAGKKLRSTADELVKDKQKIDEICRALLKPDSDTE